MHSILVIEDDRANLLFMEKVLSLAGFDVRSASKGESGIASFREKKPSLVLCDINMPGIDGYSVLGILKSDGSINMSSAMVIFQFRGYLRQVNLPPPAPT